MLGSDDKDMYTYEEAPTISDLFPAKVEKVSMTTRSVKGLPIDGKKSVGAVEEFLGLSELIKEVGAYIEDKPMTFMLCEPASLTVKKKDGGYSKRPHIGGEEFTICGVYAGKKNSIIFRFTPVEVADYSEVELSEADAKRFFNGFGSYVKGAANGEYATAARELKKAAADEAERERNKGKREQYAGLGMGTW